MLDVREERGVIDRAVEDRGRGQAVHTQPRHHGMRLPMAARRVIPEAHAARTAAIATQQIGRHARFVDEDVGAGGVERLRGVPLATGGRDVRPPLFVGVYGFLRNSLRCRRGRYERKAQALCAALKTVDDPLAVPRFICEGFGVCVRQAESERPIEKNRQFSSGGGHRCGFAGAGGESAIESSQGGLRFTDADRCSPQERGRSIRRPVSLRAEDASSRDLVTRGEAQPRREVFGGRPFRHVVPALRHKSQDGIGAETVDLAQVGA